MIHVFGNWEGLWELKNLITNELKKSKNRIQYYLQGHPNRMAFLAVFLWSTQAATIAGAYKNSIDFSTIIFPAFVSSAIFLGTFKLFYDKRPVARIFEILSLPKNIIVFIGIILFFSYHLFLFLGLHIGPKVETNLTNFLWPLLFVILGKFYYSERIKRKTEKMKKVFKIENNNQKVEAVKCDFWKILKIITGFFGIAFIITHGKLNFNLINWHGPLLGLAAAFCWAIFSVYLKFLGRDSYIAPFVGGTALLSGLVWALRGQQNFLPTLPYSIYLGIFPLGIAMIAWERAMKNGHTAEIGMLAFLAPMFSTIFLFAFNFDYLNWYSIIGGGMVVFANVNVRLTCRAIYRRTKKLIFKRNLKNRKVNQYLPQK